MARRVLVWVGAGLVMAALAGLGVYFAVVGLDKADKWASVIGVFVAISGLVVAIAGLFTDRHNSSSGGSGGGQASPRVSASGERSVAIGGDNSGNISTGDGATGPPSR